MTGELHQSFEALMRSRTARKPSTRPTAPRRPLGADLFGTVITKERKRADRLGQPCPLVSIAMRPASSFVWKPIAEAVSSVTRETDLLGWIADKSELGIVLTEVDRCDDTARRDLEQRLSHTIAKRLEPTLAARVSIRVEGALPSSSSSAYHFIKRAFDIAGSLALLVALAPLFLVIGVLVKLDSRGPMFFGQPRVGRMMKPFRMQKFRTMRVDADDKVHREYVASFIRATADRQPSGHTAVFKLTNDPRVTRVGRVLRSTSLDELPQLWNVLRGEMSLVGPRPPIPYELEQYKPWHCRRMLEAKPGMTGLWQVKGRSRTTFDEMVRLDLRYAKSCSLWTDLRILWETPRAVISGKGAC